MLMLFKYELYKIFSRKFIWLMFIVLAAVNSYNILNYFTGISEEVDIAYWKLYDKIEGEMTTDKINYIMDNYKKHKQVVDTGNFETETPSSEYLTGFVMGDMNLFDRFRTQMERLYLYNNTIEDLKKAAKNNIDFFAARGNRFEERKNRLILNSYGERKINDFYDLSDTQKYIDYDFSSFLILLSLLPGLIPVFAYEKESEMYKLISTSKNSHKKTLIAKIAASATYIILTCLFFFLNDFILFLSACHLKGFNAPVYAMESFKFSVLTMSVWKFILFGLLIKLMGFIIVGFLLLLLSKLLPDSLISFVAGAGAVIIMLVSPISIYNPLILFKNRGLFKEFSIIRIFDIPLYSFSAVIITYLLLLALLCLGIIMADKQKAQINIPSLVAKLKNKRTAYNANY